MHIRILLATDDISTLEAMPDDRDEEADAATGYLRNQSPPNLNWRSGRCFNLRVWVLITHSYRLFVVRRAASCVGVGRTAYASLMACVLGAENAAGMDCGRSFSVAAERVGVLRGGILVTLIEDVVS